MQKNEKLQAMFNVMSFKINDEDIENLAEFILKKDIYENAPNCDPYWDNRCEKLLKAFLLYIFHEGIPKEQNFATLLEILNSAKIPDEDENFISAVDLLFEKLKKKKPDHIALKYYKEYENIPAKTRVSVITNLRAKLESLDIEPLTD